MHRYKFENMKVRIKRIDKDLPLPIYETQGSVGFDLLAREDINIDPKEIKLVSRSEPPFVLGRRR